MKKMLMIFGAMLVSLAVMGDTWTDPNTGIEWTYTVSGGKASVGSGSYEGARAVPKSTTGAITIPSTLGGCPVTSIGVSAFWGCIGLTSVEMPSSVTSIGEWAFDGCSGLTSVTIPEGVTSIGDYAFQDCGELTSVTIPSSVTSVGHGVFNGCSGLKSVTLEGDAPVETSNGMFVGAPSDLVVHVKDSSSGWAQWNGRRIQFDADGGSSSPSVNMNLTITNVIVYYIQTSEQSPMVAPITKDVGLVNIMTEIKGGNVVIPDSWVSNYPKFEEKFGSNFASALTNLTGKVGAGGVPMYVWQDYVAGTDPTDENDVFKASITTDKNGKIIVSYTPELTEEEKAKRRYVTWGKTKLQDEKWVEVPSGDEDKFNFFKVTVEMK